VKASNRDWQNIPFTVIYALHIADAVDASTGVFRRTAGLVLGLGQVLGMWPKNSAT